LRVSQPLSLLAAIYSVLRQLFEGKYFLDNCYPEAVRPGGNCAAQAQLQQALHVVDANWRGIGAIPASGYTLSAQFTKHDAHAYRPVHGVG
jgi:hydrogenase expression/formation protein HypD